MKHVLIVSNDSKSLLDFRWSLIQELRRQGTSVTLVCSQDTSFAKLSQAAIVDDVTLIPYAIRNSGLNPIEDLKFIRFLNRLYRFHSITHVLLFRVKPVLYGSLAALGTQVKAIATITGLGYVYTQTTLKTRLLRLITNTLYRISLTQTQWVFFQNKDDHQFFTNSGLVSPKKSSVVGGSGVDLDIFRQTPLPPSISFLMVARLLRDKGIWEYLEAAKKLKKKYPHVDFKLAGGASDNPASIPVQDVEAFCQQNKIQYLGQVSDMVSALRQSSVFVLPSYREGMPRAGLEALSSGRPIVTTDTPGCRDLIGGNGFVIPIQDTQALMEAMEKMITLPYDELCNMAKQSRVIAETVYDVKLVNQAILEKL